MEILSLEYKSLIEKQQGQNNIQHRGKAAAAAVAGNFGTLSNKRNVICSEYVFDYVFDYVF